MQPVSQPNEPSYQFDAFELDPVRRVLLREGKAIALKPKVFETLLVLVRNSGRVMDKDELMQQVWPDTVVEEVNLAHNISVLRKALGQKADENRFIITVPGRGYGFVAEVKEIQRNATLATVSEYEVTRSRLVEEEETDEREMSDALPTYADGAGARLLPAKKPKSKVVQTLPRRRLVFAAALVVVAMAIALVLLIYRSRPSQPQPLARITSIAVLPFKPLVAENRDESLELGMADTLIARLCNIREISVRPISAVRRYAGLEQDAVAAGREQRVDAVIDGQIQKSGEKIRVTVRLVRVADGVPMWTNQFDENMSDIFRVQDSISERVVGVLAVRLSGEEKVLVAKHSTDNPDAYQLYLKGRFFWNKRTGEAISKGIDSFNQAIEKDPKYALARVALAESYVLLFEYGESTPQAAYSKARTAATEALTIDDQLTEAYTTLAYIKSDYDWDFTGAEKEYKRAIELNPNYPTAHHWYGEYLALMGRSTESIAEVRRALELEPLSLIINKELGANLYFARQYDQAVEQLQKTLDLDSSFVPAHIYLGFAYRGKKLYQEALAAFQRALSLDPENTIARSQLGHIYAVLGRRNEANGVIEQLKERSTQRPVSLTGIALIYSGCGEKDQAFEWLDKAYDQRDGYLPYVKVDPVWDSLRSDRRLAELLRRVGFPQ
jgi:DNA-binding winged helix-turn-helix (wHTH) protein/TolB-like protein/tetratricopeptide (TPR) repeat protein